MQRIPGLYVSESPLHDRGVFTLGDIPEGSLLEICPVIVIPEKDVKTIHGTALHDYYYFWGEAEKEACIALGFGSMYNHSPTPNAECQPDYESRAFLYFALRNIAAGEEITVDYNGGGNKDLLWFNDRNEL